MFSGWSTGSVSSSSDGGWSTGTPIASSGGGGSWTTGAGGGTVTGGGGTWTTGITTTQQPTQQVFYAPSYTNYQSSGGNSVGYTLPGAGVQAFIPGEGGAYTPLDFPILQELRPGQRLEDLDMGMGLAGGGLMKYLVLGGIALLLLKGK